MIRFQYFPRQVVDAGGNRWDWALLPLVLATLVLLAYGARQMVAPYQIGAVLPISLDPASLPYYLLRTTLRMFIALAASLLFSFVFAALAAKIRACEKVLVPMLDILQSIPVLGFLSITVTGFIALFPGNLFGVECAAIFAIFTSQAWNMAFSLYQSMRTVPNELQEAARVFQLSGWQRFWRLELPFAMPQLLWNMMMSMSGGWFFVVASEAISVSGQDIKLPGIGSYIAAAIDARDLGAIGWAIAAMGIGILLYDQLFFRPLLAWADKFRFEATGSDAAQSSWLLTLARRTEVMQKVALSGIAVFERSFTWFRKSHDGTSILAKPAPTPAWQSRATDAVITALVLIAAYQLFAFVHAEVGWAEAGHVFVLGFYTLVRVLLLIGLAALFWVPIGIWIGLNPRWADRLQAIAQFLAAFPANLMFPIAVMIIVHFGLNPNVWLSPLMVLGTQWYILFNVIAGASTVPTELRYAAQNLGLTGWLKWKRYLLPAVFPSFVTGAITASGGSWNASIVAEFVSWGPTTLKAEGLGSYIAQMTATGDFPRIALGIGVMCVFVMSLNHFVWRRLYRLAESKMHF
ncbi:ABC transporter permease [Jeongeupia chitinilytica]|uniref:Sulfonate ABC transporter permease n=1 Tax=Jeongeupia chitinilytica TaxID=1041641 RepID=A0ABQ3GXK6_9NEIS|nr:ABC transporter permease subunit [Jeongeupia chitinilytica]GHD56296.1 sulfonate ABC transporter permease [Jeongeupia chitinilytica]